MVNSRRRRSQRYSLELMFFIGLFKVGLYVGLARIVVPFGCPKLGSSLIRTWFLRKFFSASCFHDVSLLVVVQIGLACPWRKQFFGFIITAFPFLCLFVAAWIVYPFGLAEF